MDVSGRSAEVRGRRRQSELQRARSGFCRRRNPSADEGSDKDTFKRTAAGWPAAAQHPVPAPPSLNAASPLIRSGRRAMPAFDGLRPGRQPLNDARPARPRPRRRRSPVRPRTDFWDGTEGSQTILNCSGSCCRTERLVMRIPNDRRFRLQWERCSILSTAVMYVDDSKSHFDHGNVALCQAESFRCPCAVEKSSPCIGR